MLRLLATLRRLQILPILAIILVIGLIAYAVARGSNDDTTPSSTESPLAQATSFPPAVRFVSPLDGATVSNPVNVHMAIGGLRFQGAGESPRPGYGHLLLIIDGGLPAAGETFASDATHIDLADDSFVKTLPPLSPGQHKLTVVFANSLSIITDPALSQTITVIVSQ